MVKKSKLSIDTSKVTKERAPEITEKELVHFTTKLTEWACENEDALDPIEFVMKWGIKPRAYQEWKEKYPIVAEADEIAREYIGLRRDENWLSGEHVSGADKYLPAFKGLYRKHIMDMKQFDAMITERLETMKSKLRKDLQEDISEVLVKMLEIPKKVKDEQKD